MLFAAQYAKKASSLVLWSNCNEDLYWVTLPAQFCVLDWTCAFLGAEDWCTDVLVDI